MKKRKKRETMKKNGRSKRQIMKKKRQKERLNR